MADSFSQFLKIFQTEAAENVILLEENILLLEENPNDYEIMNIIFRAAHTIKGSAGLVGQKDIQEFMHAVEDLLDKLRNKELAVSDAIIDTILKSIDIVKKMLQNLKNNLSATDNVDYSNIYDTLKKHVSNEITQIISEETRTLSVVNTHIAAEHIYIIQCKFIPNILEQGIDPLMFLRDLSEMGKFIKIHINCNDIPEIEKYENDKIYLSWNVLFLSAKTLAEIRDVFLFVMDENKILIQDITEFIKHNDGEKLSEFSFGGLDILLIMDEYTEKTKTDININKKNYKKENSGNNNIQVKIDQEKNQINNAGSAEEKSSHVSQIAEETFVKVPTQKLDLLLNTVSELVISQSQITQTVEQMSGRHVDRLRELASLIDKHSRSLQEQTMSLRMINLGPTFQQFRRMIRDTAQANNKKVRLVISGEETELDKNIITRINDPLKHMIRNSIDHGIELPEIRRKAGKDETGVISLDAYYEEGSVVIVVKDDGAGLNREKIEQKIIEKQLAENTKDLSDSEIFKFIFMPGFSTADKVTAISGRGVGMDVVLTNIKELNGVVDIQSKLYEGSTFFLKLPLTLAIIDGMLLTVKEHVFILPLLSIEESFKPAGNLIQYVQGNMCVFFRGEYIRIIVLAELFGISGAHTDPSKGLLVVVKTAGIQYAILVDNLLAHQQIVLKPLKVNIKGISSATILGDGKVALDLDLNGIYNYT